MYIHIQKLPPWKNVFLSHHFKKMYKPIRTTKQSRERKGEAEQGLLNTSVQRSAGGKGGGERTMNTGFNEREREESGDGGG